MNIETAVPQSAHINPFHTAAETVPSQPPNQAVRVIPRAGLFVRLGLIFVLSGLLVPWRAGAEGTWIPLQPPLAPAGIGTMLLLSDGTVMAEGSSPTGTNAWYRLAPGPTGGYTNGVWSTRASMKYKRLYFSSAVLPDGRVFVAGAEYGNGTTNAEIYNPIYSPNPDSWAEIPVPPGLITVNNNITNAAQENNAGFVDSGSIVLPDGKVLVMPVDPATSGGTVLFDPKANSLSAGPTLAQDKWEDEASVVKLPDDSVLVIDAYTTTSERLIPSANMWVGDANAPVNPYDPFGEEMGAGFLLPNGEAFFIGSTPVTAIYTPSGNTSPGTWIAGPNIPNNLGAPDAPAAMMVNGKILCALSPTPYNLGGTNYIFTTPTYFYEYDYSAGASGAFTQVHAPGGGLSVPPATYPQRMLDLPDGTVLFAYGGTDLYVYKPDGSPLASGKPVVQTISQNMDGSLQLTGTGFNGISAGASYGDDVQADSNYPLLRFTDGSGNVFYGTTYNWSSTGVMTSNKVISTQAVIPANIANGSLPCSLQIVANGIASDPMAFYPLDYPTVSFITPTNGAVGSDAYAPLILGNADDSSSAISSVQVALKRTSDGAWYDFVGSAWGSSTFDLNRNVLNATGVVAASHTSWAAQLPAMSAGNYSVQAQSVNAHLNASPWFSVAFTIESAPVVTFSPLTDLQVVFNFNQLGGTVNETSTVKFEIEWFQAGGNMFWNGVNWTSVESEAGVLLAANTSGLNWTPAPGTLPQRYQLAQASYVVRVYATDAVGDVSSNAIVLTRSPLDTTPPIVNLDSTSIQPDEVFTNRFLPPVFGLAYDPESGVASVNVLLDRITDSGRLYWDGANWTATPINLPATYTANDISWHLNAALPSGDNLPNGSYSLDVSAANNEAPSGSGLLTRNFSVDYHPVYVFNYGSQFGPTPNMNWDSPDNWDVGSEPTPDAWVIITNYTPNNTSLGSLQLYRLDLSGGTLITSGMLIQKLNLSGGQINGGALTLTNNGTNVWSGGILTVGTLTVLGGSTLILTNNVNHDLPNCTLTNYGSVVWGSGSIRGGGSGSGTLVYNYGLWDVQCDQVWDNSTYQNYGTVFNNYGTLRKSVGTNSSQTVFPGGVVLNQLAGMLDVQQGNFSLQGGASFAGGYTTTNTTGTVLLASGGYNVNGSVTSSNVVESGGNLVGVNVINGSLTWLGGIWNGATVTVASNSTVYLASSASMDMANTTLTNNGRVLWGSGSIRGGGSGSGTLVYNYGLWDVQCDQVWDNSTYQNYGTVFNNYGTLRKSVGTNSSQTVFPGGVVLNQLAGMLDVQQGNFSLQGGASFAGGYTTTNTTGTVLLASGGYNVNGSVTSSNVVESGGNLVGVNVINGSLTWLGGIWNGATVTVASNSTVYLASSASMDMANTTLTNNGRVLWGSGSIRGGGSGSGTLVYNYGLWDVQCDQVWDNSTYQNYGTVFNNYGTLRKSVGTNSSQTVFPGGVVLNQLAGMLDVQQGNFSLQGGASFAGGYTTTNTTGTVLLASGGFNLNGTVTGTNVVENGGNLIGNNVIHGSLTWLGGYWNGATVTVTTNSTVYLASSANMDMANTVVTNNGTVLWSSGSIRGGGSGSGTLVYNYGLWDVQCDQVWDNSTYQNYGTVFNNYGTLRKSVGTNSSQTVFPGGVYLNQLSGMLDVQRGNFNLQGVVNFVGGYVTTNNTGTTILSGGNFSLVGGLTSSNVVENGGVPVGNNVIHGALTWLSGNWNSVTMTVATNSTVYLSGVGNLDVANSTLNNNGTVLWGGGYFRGGGFTGGTLVNNYGLWDVQCDQVWNYDAYQGSGTVFNNYGTLRKSVGTNSSQTLFTGGVYLNQLSGMLDVQRGNFSLQGGASFVGGFVTTNNTGTTILSGGNFNLSGGLTSSNVVENGGIPVGNNVVHGALTWLSGNWNSVTMTVATNSTVYLSGVGNLDVANSTLNNNGTVLWGGGYFRGGGFTGGTLVNNYGLWDVQCDQVWNYDAYQGSGTTFNNYGTFRKESSVGTTTFTPGSNFNTPGTVDLRSGTVAFNGAVYPGPTTKLTLAIGGLNAGTQFGSESFGFPPPFTGTLGITLTNGFVPTNGNSFVIATFPSSTGQFSSIQFPPLPSVSKWQLTYNTSSLVLQVVPSTIFVNSSLTNGNFQFTFVGQTGSSCLIEASTNLLNWIPLFTNTPFNGTLNFVDPHTAQFTNRYYRATIFP